MNNFDLEGRVAVITGGNGGIGLGIAEGLALAGANTMIGGRNLDKNTLALDRLRTSGGKHEAFVVDVTDKSSIRELIDTTQEMLGPIDILVNNAGIYIGAEPEVMCDDDWNLVLQTNLQSIVWCSQAAFDDLSSASNRGHQGKIINIGSMYSLFGADHSIAYAASKGGVVQLTKSQASAWAKHGINVNSILPGWIETDMTASIPENPEFYNSILDRTPFKRFGKIEEMAGSAVFLASSASDFVTGVALPVDGGYGSS